MATAFDEVQFDPAISYGAQGGPMFSTDIVVTGSGAEQRVSVWSNGRLRWDVTHGLKTMAQLQGLIAFFRARQGRLRGFRFKDWSDYKAVNCAPRRIGTGQYQLVQRYRSGEQEQIRDIKKPVQGTFALRDKGSPVGPGAYSLDYKTGVLTWGGATYSACDVMFALDVSGSMNDPLGAGQSKLSVAKSGMVSSLNTLQNDNPANRTGLVTFDTAAYHRSALTGDFATLSSVINSLTILGGTDINAGLSAGISDMTAQTQPGQRPVFIVMSDGDGGTPIPTAQQMKQQHPDWLIYAIGIYNVPDLVGQQTMQGVGIDGYFPVLTVQDFQNAFATIMAGLVTIACDFEFDVPVRFDTDTMKFDMSAATFGSWQQVPVIELLQ